MNISPKQRFLDICYFKRPGDLYISDGFWPSTLEEWVKQGAPKQIVPTFEEPWGGGRFLSDYFHFERYHLLTEVISAMSVVSQPFGLGYEINLTLVAPPVVPDYEPRITSEDEHTITFINGAGQTLNVLKDNPSRMPMYVDWPAKDRASWNEYKKRLDPNTPERYPSDWNAYLQEMNKLGEQTPIALSIGGSFFGVIISRKMLCN